MPGFDNPGSEIAERALACDSERGLFLARNRNESAVSLTVLSSVSFSSLFLSLSSLYLSSLSHTLFPCIGLVLIFFIDSLL